MLEFFNSGVALNVRSVKVAILCSSVSDYMLMLIYSKILRYLDGHFIAYLYMLYII